LEVCRDDEGTVDGHVHVPPIMIPILILMSFLSNCYTSTLIKWGMVLIPRKRPGRSDMDINGPPLDPFPITF
jgi:hypothetical protein